MMSGSEQPFGATVTDAPPPWRVTVAPERNVGTGRYRPGGDRADKHRQERPDGRRRIPRRRARWMAGGSVVAALAGGAVAMAVAGGSASRSASPTTAAGFSSTTAVTTAAIGPEKSAVSTIVASTSTPAARSSSTAASGIHEWVPGESYVLDYRGTHTLDGVVDASDGALFSCSGTGCSFVFSWGPGTVYGTYPISAGSVSFDKSGTDTPCLGGLPPQPFRASGSFVVSTETRVVDGVVVPASISGAATLVFKEVSGTVDGLPYSCPAHTVVETAAGPASTGVFVISATG